MPTQNPMTNFQFSNDLKTAIDDLVYLLTDDLMTHIINHMSENVDQLAENNALSESINLLQKVLKKSKGTRRSKKT